MSTHCPICSCPTPDMTKRFHENLKRFVCPDCFEFSDVATAALRRAGAEGVEPNPVRYSPEPEKLP